jgi:hypothetical protein
VSDFRVNDLVVSDLVVSDLVANDLVASNLTVNELTVNDLISVLHAINRTINRTMSRAMNRAMNRHCAIATGLLSSLLLLGSPSTPPVQAETEMEMPAAEDTLDTKFQQVDQPLSAKAAVTVGGLALIAAELWWFLGKRR